MRRPAVLSETFPLPARVCLVLLLLLQSALAQVEEPVVTITVQTYPPCQVFLEGPLGRKFLGGSNAKLRFTPPCLTSKNGDLLQYSPGTLVLQAPDHEELRVNVPAQDWRNTTFPQHGTYVLVPAGLTVRLRDFVEVYPAACVGLAVGATLGLGLLGFAVRQYWGRRTENILLHQRLNSHGDPLLGRQLGSYSVQERLGQGGMGTVYRVQDHSGGLYAMKVIYVDTYANEELRRFRREFKVMQSLNHQNLVRAFDFSEERGQAYIVMEIVEGTCLTDLIPADGMSWREAWPLIRQMIEGLICAHSKGIVHRDFKPSNIMVSTAGHLKILDFGLSRQQDRTAVTLSGYALGTPSYMAPEQVSSSSKEVKPSSDQYSLGIVIFEMLTGRLPFNSEDPTSLISMHAVKTAPLLSAYRQDIQPELVAAVARMLEKAPTQRFASLEDVLSVLEAVDPYAPTVQLLGPSSPFYLSPHGVAQQGSPSEAKSDQTDIQPATVVVARDRRSGAT